MFMLDISNLWNGLSLPDLLGCEPELFDVHRQLLDNFDDRFADWTWQKSTAPNAVIQQLRDAAARIRHTSDSLVVVGTDEATLGIRAALELIRGCRHNDNPAKPRIYFTGNDVSSRDFRELLNILDDRDFSVCFITHAGTTLESALAYRSLKWKLTAKYGEREALSRIYVFTEENKGHLFHRMQEQGVTVFGTPRSLCGRFSVLSACGLLPLMVAGVDVMELLQGAENLYEQTKLASFDNPAWLYCAGRRLLWAQNRPVELLACPEQRALTLGTFWQRLFADVPGPMVFPTLHNRDTQLADHRSNVFETCLWMEEPEDPVMVEATWDNTDPFSFLEGRSFDAIAHAAMDGRVEWHSNLDIPAFLLECGQPNAHTVGEILHFLEFSAVLWSAWLGYDPFTAKSIPESRRFMLKILDAPSSC